MTEIFKKQFYSECTAITDSLTTLDAAVITDKIVLLEKYDEVSKRTETLRLYFTENTSYIPAYEVRKAQEELNKLSKFSQERRDVLFPKKKFGFKSKAKIVKLDSAIDKANIVSSLKEDQKSKAQTSDQNFNLENFEKSSNSCVIKDLENRQDVVKLGSDINGKDIAIVNVKNCVLQLRGNPSVVHAYNLENCTILCGPVTGSVFITKCTNAQIVVACHQLRIHETRMTQFYINVVSRAIIENCKTVSFAPYAWEYPLISKDYSQSSIEMEKVNWEAVDDFNWLSQETKSPNWSFLDEAGRVKWQTNETGELTKS